MALQHYLDLREENKPPTDFIMQLTEFIIHNNVFLFTDMLFKQVIGVPMGNCFSPMYS